MRLTGPKQRRSASPDAVFDDHDSRRVGERRFHQREPRSAKLERNRGNAGTEPKQLIFTLNDEMGTVNHFDRGSAAKPGYRSETTLWIERSVLVLLFVGLLAGVLAVLRPFTTALLFGAALASAAWPVRQALVNRGLGRGTAAVILLIFSILLVAVPMLIVAPSLADQLGNGMQRAEAYFAAAPQQPAWLGDLPLVGKRLAAAWGRIVEAQGNLRALLEPYAGDVQSILVGVARALADSLVQVILSLAVAAMFWVNGEALVGVLHDCLLRLGGRIADQAVDVAAGAIRGVAYGVVGTAAIQATVLAVGLAIAGVPGVAMLGFVALLLAISQIGAPLIVLIWGGAAWWLFGQDHQAWAVFMIVWGLLVSTLDNVIKPWLIGFGVEMPLSLTILGVFGGFIAFGFLGLFIGPILIAVAFHLLQAWQAASEPT
jgi:predicted PurR-regulated permease PerM